MIKKIIYLCIILPLMLLANEDLQMTLTDDSNISSSHIETITIDDSNVSTINIDANSTSDANVSNSSHIEIITIDESNDSTVKVDSNITNEGNVSDSHIETIIDESNDSSISVNTTIEDDSNISIDNADLCATHIENTINPPSYFRIVNLTENQVTVEWDNNFTNVTEFVILDEYNREIRIDANITSTTIENLEADTLYTFAIYAQAGTVNSVEKYLTFRTKLRSVSEVNASKISSNAITLSWENNSSTAEGIKIYSENKLIKTLSSDVTSYTISNLKHNTVYSYMIESYNNSGVSDGVMINVRTKKSNDVPITHYILD